MADFDIQRAFEGVYERLNTVVENQAVASTHIKSLLGNGQPGRITLIENRLYGHGELIEGMKRQRQFTKGYIAGVGGIVIVFGWIGHIIIDYVLPNVGVLKHP